MLGLLAAQAGAPIGRLAWTLSLRDRGHGRSPGLLTVTALTLVQLLPLAVLLAGALALAAVRLRAWWVERHYGLRPADPSPPGAPTDCDDIQRFLTEQAPGTQLRIGLRQDLLARVYPGGLRTARVGVFSPLVGLWARDREAAEAVLRHEIGHLRNGEQHVAGLGSPFTGLVRAWPYAFAVCGLLPVALLAVSGDPTAPLMSAQIVLVLLSVPKVVLVVTGALWSAELAADRYAAGTAASEAQIRALNELDRTAHSALVRLYHPPVRVRLWFVARAGQPTAQLLLVLLWPAVVLAVDLLGLLGGALAYRLLGGPWADDPALRALALTREQLVRGPTWWAVLGTLALWPLITRPWNRLWRCRGPAGGPVSPAVYASAALFPVLVLLLGLIPAGPRPGDLPTVSRPAEAPTAAGGPVPTPCPRRSRPAPPARPAGLPSFGVPQAAGPTEAGRARSFRTLGVLSVRPLLGSAGQAQDVADRLAGARWTLDARGNLTTDDAGVPLLRTTAVRGGTRFLHGDLTRTTDVSVTTTWTDARLRSAAGSTVRLDVINASTGVTHAVVACRAFDSTVTAAVRLTLRLVQR
ncbi:M48 family metalloprotease [Streptomyces sp. NPDC047000]|uniref:M48 family metalloprotease n=1 Tax=Streptomyces sp. NPDC047000 TaxID=3155474 RepID=UPI0033F10F1C